MQVDSVLGAAVYVVKVSVGTLEKVVRRRYSEFDALRTLTHKLVKSMAENARESEGNAAAKAFEAAATSGGFTLAGMFPSPSALSATFDPAA